MKSFLYIITLVVCSFVSSCSSNDSSTKKEDVELYRVSWENVYDCYDEREDTLLYGLSYMYKVIRRYSDGKQSFLLELLIEDPDLITGNPYVRCIYLDVEEISKLNAFLDSCLSEPQKRNERWELRLKSDATLSYDEYNKTIVFWCNQGHKVGLQITPQRMKEVLTKVMEDENLRDD